MYSVEANHWEEKRLGQSGKVFTSLVYPEEISVEVMDNC
eukprot:CAMPEP_0173156712 /NCGR_PEP_ID=MMETSP1105-20130129/15035_1 /TAXON_ID=2985 /ORGANISM="Ochromonas sp., Strain BG-1" /LENGTH=38 /DNA_ID= /DNA_START= /DNA_END= /DNA_ORIENTATION=